MTRAIAICRRRLRVVATFRYLGLAIPSAIVATEILAIILRLPAGQIAAAGIALTTLGVAACVAGSTLRAPSMRATAVAIDARLRLQDRTVTALQLADEPDEMSRLVVRDAAARVASLSPSQTFPLEAPPHFRGVIGAAVAVTLLFVVLVAGPGQSWLFAPGGMRSASGPAAGGRAVRTATPGSAGQPSDETASSTSATATRLSNQSSRRDPGPGRETRSDADTRAQAGPEERSASSNASGSSRDAGAAAGAGDRGRGASAFASRAEAAAGGVNGAAIADMDRDVNTRRAVPGDAGYASRYQLASTRAEAAVAQERVPARLRAYVQRYFVAIHP